LQGVAQGLNHMHLPDHFRKTLGSVFAGQNEVRHGLILSGCAVPPKAGLSED
jgi:hypothetical protein